MDSPGATGAARAASRIDPLEELELLRTLVRKAPTGIAVFDLDLRFLLVNERLAEINGLPVAAHLGHALARDEEHGVWAFGPPAARGAAAGAGPVAAPDFRLPDLDGRMHALSEQRGKKVLLYCWASW
jgi:PAS domain-containing protein